MAHRSRLVARLGVRVGMPLTEARLLIASEPVVMRPHEPERDAAALRKLAHRCERFSPWFGIASAEPHDSVLLDVTGCDHLDGGEESMLRRIVSTFRNRGWTVRLGLADSVSVAWAITHAASGGEPSGSVAIVSSGLIAHRERLRPLPLSALRFPIPSLISLERLGVRTVADWERLPQADLKSRFGAETVLRWRQACGEVDEAIVPLRPEQAIEAGEAFEWPIANQRALLTVVERLMTQVMRGVRKRHAGEGIAALRIRLGMQSPIEIGFARPTDRPDEAMGIVAARLERERLSGPIGAITIRVTETVSANWRQGDLFETNESRTERVAVGEVNSLLDRLRTRLSAEQITRPQLRENYLPEEAQTLVPIERLTVPQEKTTPKRRPKRHSKQTPLPAKDEQVVDLRTGWTPSSRPSTLLPVPEPITVIHLHPDGPPRQVTRGNATLRVVRCWGPERIETGWWDDQQHKRDYYRIELEDGSRWWVYRDLRAERWFLHGLFD